MMGIKVPLPGAITHVDAYAVCAQCVGLGQVKSPVTGNDNTCPRCGGEGLVAQRISLAELKELLK